MLKIGDRVTVVWDLWDKAYPTQTFSVIKSEENITPIYRRKGNIIWYDTDSPLWNALKMGAERNPSYYFTPRPDIRRHKWLTNIGWHIHQVNILNVENITDKLEAGYKPLKTEELQDILDQGRILEFEIPDYFNGTWKWKLFPKIGEDYEHRLMVSGKGHTKGFVDFRKAQFEYSDFYNLLTARTVKDWTSFERIVNNDFRALQRLNTPAISFNNTLPKYLTKVQIPHTDEQKKEFAKQLWGEHIYHLPATKKYSRTKREKKEDREKRKKHLQGHTSHPKKKERHIQRQNNENKNRKKILKKEYSDLPTLPMKLGDNEARNKRYLKGLEGLDKEYTVRVDDKETITIVAKSSSLAYTKALEMGYTSALVHSCDKVLPNPKYALERAVNASKRKYQRLLREEKKGIRQLDHISMVCICNKEKTDYLRMSKNNATNFIKDNENYDYCGKEEWKAWKNGEIRRPAGKYFENSYSKSWIYHKANVRANGIRPRPKPKGIPGSRHKIIQRVEVLRPSEKISIAIVEPTYYTWEEKQWNKGSNTFPPKSWYITRYKYHFDGMKTLDTVEIIRPDRFVYKDITVQPTPEKMLMNIDWRNPSIPIESKKKT